MHNFTLEDIAGPSTPPTNHILPRTPSTNHMLPRTPSTNHIAPRLSNIKQFYTKLLHRDPITLRAMEALLRSVSYISSGRFSPQISELFFMCSNLLQYVNDKILSNEGIECDDFISIDIPNESCIRLQSMLHVVQCVEVFVELSALRVGGEAVRWIVIVAISIAKSVIRLILLLKYGKVLQGAGNDVGKSDKPSGWVGERTGIFFKSVNSSDIVVAHSTHHIYAEVAYIARPIIHLATLACFSSKSWVPLMLSLAAEIYSLKTLNEIKNPSERQKLELEKRKSSLLLYTFRSPCYNALTERCVNAVLGLVSGIPLVNLVAENVLDYLPEWQSVYFYTWSS